MNRLLTEGRRAFLRRVSGIERGADCARYEPLLTGLADGEASPEELAQLRPHMRTCLSCRAALREFRAMPERVASVVPPVTLASGDGGGPLRGLFESVLGAAQHKTAAIGERLHAAAELATGQKVAAVAASAAALAGGGTAVHELSDGKRPLQPAQAQSQPGVPPKKAPPVEAPATPVPPPSIEEAEPEPAPPPSPPPEPPPPPPEPAQEFVPAPASEPAAPGPTGSAGEFGGPGGGGFTGAGGEFAP